MTYAEVVVVVDGSIEETEIFHDYALEAEYIAQIEEEAMGHGYPVEVFIAYHEHAVSIECPQLATSNAPAYSFNTMAAAR